MAGISVRVLKNEFPNLPGKVRSRAGQVSQRTAYRIRDDAKTRVPVDTGETRDNIEAVKEGAFTWRVDSHRPSTDGSANVPQFLEFGTSKMPARPYLTPAAEAARSFFGNEIDKILDGIL